ncbi:Pc20g04210 [Penicillium rubens Wisconsin 54-1255]|uniref:Pc20g04210 protein n=1 Tax=Penicillium rubens (strain ATCC 28089 / DSM 1075 / NRRL 1951 / Wisconsin 54-1255) TaxID=500485 RepID=B6HDA5_PENRW|nr:Pc20g04210 [Penicillium rubens Wisconsin 54-1255]
MENTAISNSDTQQSKKEQTMSRPDSIDIGQEPGNPEDPSKSNETELSAAIREAVNHRRLNPRQIQLTAIAGSIGAALFVGIGSGVMSGPLCLFLAFIFWATIVFSIAQCQVEVVTLFPLDGAFIRLAGRMVDPALGVAVGYNHFFAQTSFVIFEATVINTLVEYWGYNQSPAVLISSRLFQHGLVLTLLTASVSLVLYLAINVYRADLFGEAEFWLALGKVLLATGLIVYTIVVMLGGNPLNDRFGFRYWKDPGPWAGADPSNRLMSFVNAVNVAAFCMGGPEYISMIAGESRDPRRTVPRAFNTIMTRLIVFFIGGCLCVGFHTMIRFLQTDRTATPADPHSNVISMQRLQIPVLPSIVNAALLTTIVSAGNAYTFNASRSLHALALDGRAPKFLKRLNKRGVPYMAVIVVMLLSCLAYLALGSSSAEVLNWILKFAHLVSALLLLCCTNWTVMSFTWIRFNAALNAQGIDRKSFLPRVSRYQPYAGYWAFFWAFIFLWVQGYAVFIHGNWKVSTFIFNYGIIALASIIGISWKIFKHTPFHKSKDVDLFSGLDFFDALTEHYRQEREAAPVTVKDKIMAKIF